MRTTVVGRTAEIAQIRDLVRRAASGYGATVLVEGEPGIGKSALLTTAAAEARRIGARVLRGGCAPTQAPPPFTALRAWLPAEIPADADEELLVTERLLDRLESWCAVGPLVVLVDDLQWADPSSLLLLGRLGRAVGQLPLLLVAAYRPTPRDARLDALQRGLRARGAVSMALDPLRDDHLAELVTKLLGVPPAPRLRELLARAGGNPLYATEVLGSLARTGRIQVAGGVATLRPGSANETIPTTLVDLIRRRLDALNETTFDMLRVAAVLGSGFDLTELASVLDTPVLELWEPVSEAVRAGLLVDAGDQMVFRHDLIRQVLADDLPTTAADELRLRAGRALAGAGAGVDRVARHLAAATGLAPDLVDWLTRAAEALIVRAPELATPLLERALTQRAADSPAVLRLQYARALLWAGRPGEAQRVAQEALRGDGTHPVALHWVLAQAYLQTGRLAQARAVAEKALRSAGCTEAEAARLHGLVGQCLLLSGRADAAAEAVNAALPGAEGYDRAYALTVWAGAQLVRQRPQEALDLADRAIAALGGDQIQPDRPFAPQLVRGLCLLELDRFADAEAAFAEGRTRDGRPFLAWHHLTAARMRYLQGRWDDALTEIRAGLDAPDGLGVTHALRSQEALIAAHRGDADPHTERRPHRDPHPYWAWLRLSVRALRRERAGDLDRAQFTLLGAWSRGAPGSCLAADLARVAARTGQRWRVRDVADALDTVAGHHGGPHVRATALLCRGVAEADPALLLAAAQAFAEAGRPLQEGYAYEEAADVLAAAQSPAPAREALDSAVRCYELLGAAWDLDRARERLRGAGVRHRQGRRRPKTGWEALTKTERRVVALVVAGRSNPDIAAELYLSRRTVRNHVSHILAKLGLSSRVELAISAYEKGAR